MLRIRLGLAACAVLWVGTGQAQPPSLEDFAGPADDPKLAAREAAIEALARRIDSRLAEKWDEVGVSPAAPVTDAEFLRRAYLDIAGRIPRVGEARGFLESTDPDRRTKLVRELLDSPGYARHSMNLTRDEWMPGTAADSENQFRVIQVETWLRDRFAENTPYDQMVRRLLLAPLNARPEEERENADVSAAREFFRILELKPEEAGSSTSRLFIGVKLECAQCHDHPFAPYSRQQFWEYAAFFNDIQAGLPRPRPGRASDYEMLRRIRIPNTERMATARYIDGAEPDWQPDQTPRQALAEWLVNGDNPFFARNAVNRAWERFFGRGIVDPVDEPGDENPPSHPELLGELADAFVANGYDLKFLAEAITRTRAYQLSSHATDPSQHDPSLFARMAVKGLGAEQVYDSFLTAVGVEEEESARFGYSARDTSRPRGRFLNRFASTERATERSRSILQALMLMNGDFLNEQTRVGSGRTLTAIARMPFVDTAERVETLFIAALSRYPTPEESSHITNYVRSGGADGDPDAALGDVFWALLNSSEFMANH